MLQIQTKIEKVELVTGSIFLEYIDINLESSELGNEIQKPADVLRTITVTITDDEKMIRNIRKGPMWLLTTSLN